MFFVMVFFFSRVAIKWMRRWEAKKAKRKQNIYYAPQHPDTHFDFTSYGTHPDAHLDPSEQPLQDANPLHYDDLPYRTKQYIFSTTEFKFYETLLAALGGHAIICPKIGIKDFIDITTKVPKQKEFFFRKIAQKHIDFLLCDPATMKPICGIELDDGSHKQPEVMERDAFVNNAYRSAGIPLVRFSAKPYYDQQAIKEALSKHIPALKPAPKPQPTDDDILAELIGIN